MGADAAPTSVIRNRPVRPPHSFQK